MECSNVADNSTVLVIPMQASACMPDTDVVNAAVKRNTRNLVRLLNNHGMSFVYNACACRSICSSAINCVSIRSVVFFNRLSIGVLTVALSCCDLAACCLGGRCISTEQGTVLTVETIDTTVAFFGLS